ncbi:hypothetical protein [Neobacillus vireti]|uniref:hypothetical protein n=1 Tax=Neobacillus vireti TaxID=220686 RepID=UPI002FFE1215
MEDSTLNNDTEIHDLNENGGDHNQDFSDLEALTTRINELAANILIRENHLKDELATKKENIASITTSLENSNKEIAELRASNEENQTLIGALRSLVAEQEIQLKELKEIIGTKEQVITSFAVSLENSKKEIAELHKKVDEMKAINESKETLIGEYKEKLDSLSGLVSLLTYQQSKPQSTENPAQEVEPKVKEESSALEAVQSEKEKNLVLKADRKAQMKTLKKLLKKNPNAEEKVLAEQLGVDSSVITELRKKFDI